MLARSYLFVPGNRPERFERAVQSGADVVIIDLEDAVSADSKDDARRAVASWLSPDHLVYVRVNGPQTPWFELDLAAIRRPGLAGILVPKTEDPVHLEAVGASWEGARRVIPIIETALGLWEVRRIVESPHVERLAFGSLDFQLDSGILGEDEELQYARSVLVLASRVAGIASPIDGVTTALDDLNRVERDVHRARRFGFGAKLCVHPRQVPVVNQGFAPTAAELDWARRVLEAENTSDGVITVDGQMIDRPLFERARTLVQRHKDVHVL